MTDNKRPTPTYGPFGLSYGDIGLLSVLILVLAVGLVLLFPRQGSGSAPVAGVIPTPTPTQAEEATPAGTLTLQPTDTPPTPIPTPTEAPTEPALSKEVATPTPAPTMAPSPTPAEETPTSPPAAAMATPTAEPPTDTPTPASKAATDTSTPTPSSTPSDLPTITPILTIAPTPTPFPARVIYVQGQGQSHTLGLVTSEGDIIKDLFHLHASAPAWSPNGTTIAFFGEDGIRDLGEAYEGGRGVWVIEMIDIEMGEYSNPRKLSGEDYVNNMTWSPDGEKLALEFAKPDSSREIIVIDKNGNKLHSFEGPEQPAWKADGKKLVVRACNPSCGLWQVSPDGKFDSEPLTDPDHASASFPALSRDGKYMTFSSKRDGDYDIYLLDLDTNELKQLTNRAGDDTTPVFSPDDQEIYIRTNHFGDWRIMVMALDGSNERIVKEEVGDSVDWGKARPAVY